MADEVLKHDANARVVGGGVSDDSDQDVLQFRVDSITKRMLVETDDKSVTAPTIYNIAITLADTEYSQALPDNTRKFRIYAVDNAKTSFHTDLLKLYFSAGATAFIPIFPGNYHEESKLNLTSKTLYFQSPTGSAYAIIIVWT